MLLRAAETLGACLGALTGWAAGAPWRGYLLVALVALAVVLPGIAALPVTDRDEGRFVQATKQMLETGDFVDIRFQDQPRWKKPIGIYWLQAGAASVFGGTEAPIWAYRLPSALAVVLAALATLWAARALLAPGAALLAGLMLPTALLAAAEANIAKTDAALLLSATLAFGALVRVLTGQAGRFTWLVFWLALAGAVLLKGPIVPVIAALAVAGVWIGGRARPPLGGLRPVPGMVLMAALVAPWLIAIWIVSQGQFFAEAVGKDLLGKVAEGQEKHWGPPGLYLALVWLTFWPWAAFLPAAIARTWRDWRTAPVLILAAWVVPFWIVLEAVPTKLPHYVLPLYPALAILVALAIPAIEEAPQARWMRRSAALLVAVPGVVLGLAAMALPVVLEGVAVPGAVIFGLIGAGAALAAGLAAWHMRIRAQLGASFAAALAIYAAVLQFGLPALATAFPSPTIAGLAAPWRACASGPLVSVGYREPSLIFLAGTATRLDTPEQAARRIAADPGTLVAVEDRWRARLDAALGNIAPTLIARGEASYFNPNRGKWQTVRLVTRDDPRWEACAP